MTIQLILEMYLPSFLMLNVNTSLLQSCLTLILHPIYLQRLFKMQSLLTLRWSMFLELQRKEIHFTCLRTPSQLASCRHWVSRSGAGQTATLWAAQLGRGEANPGMIRGLVLRLGSGGAGGSNWLARGRDLSLPRDNSAGLCWWLE